MNEFKTLFIFGVGVIIGIIAAHYCTHKPIPTREAKKQSFKPHVVAKGQGNATREPLPENTLVASHNKKANS